MLSIMSGASDRSVMSWRTVRKVMGATGVVPPQCS
jgi:hypothetical protein